MGDGAGTQHLTAVGAALLVLAVSGCSGIDVEVRTTQPTAEVFIESTPVEDPEPIERGVEEEVLFASVSECLEGNWVVDNEVFGEFFLTQNPSAVSAEVDGLASVVFEDGSFRMYFDDFDVRYATGNPEFLLTRTGNETVQFSVSPDGVVEVEDRTNTITQSLFSLVGEEGEALPIAVRGQAFLPFDGSRLVCDALSTDVYVGDDLFRLLRL